MKTVSTKVRCVALIAVISFLFPICHSEAALEKGPAQKFARGMAHIVTSPFQIPKEMIQTAAETEPVYLAPWKGFAVGGGTGIYLFGRQLVSGFSDVFTFWTPAGRDWAPLFEPSTLFPEI